MDSEFKKKLDSVTAFRDNRQQYSNEIIRNKDYFPQLLKLCFESSNGNRTKSCWILELVCYEKPEWFQEHLDFLCSKITTLRDESAIRAISKVCLLLATSHFKKKEIQLSENNMLQIMEACFDWLIRETKVASKCYSIRTLHLLGHHFAWIHPELKIIIEKDYLYHSAAYKAVAREVLKKIK